MTQQLHPDLVAVAQSLRDAGIIRAANANISQTRAYIDHASAFTAAARARVAHELELSISGPYRDIPAKLYWDGGAEPMPLLFYCHGGGFRQGSVAAWDAPSRQLARDSGAAILSIDYALSPENPFPQAFDEVVVVMRTVIAAACVANRPVKSFAAAGDSAGANLILGAALALRDIGTDALCHLTLFYGVYSKDVVRPSWQTHGDYGLSSSAMQEIWANYLSADEDDWRVQPLHAELARLPTIRLVIGDLDPLLDENRALAEKLVAAGVTTTLSVIENFNHGFIRYNEAAPSVRAMLHIEGLALKEAFNLDGDVVG